MDSALAEAVEQAVVEGIQAQSGGSAEVAAWFGKFRPVLRLTAQSVALLYEAEPTLEPSLAGARISAALAEHYSAEKELARWFSTYRPLIDLVAGGVAAGLQQQSVVAPSRSLGAGSEGLPADLYAPAARTQANLRAIELLSRGAPFSAQDRAALRLYSGWGGLSIDKIRDRLPPEWVPDSAALIHEYYTPRAVCRAIARLVTPLLGSVPALDRPLLALEPAAGVGRFLDAFEAEGAALRWVACEFSKPSARILSALHPTATVFVGPFEQWVNAQVGKLGQRLGLVVSNPPYGERGASVTLDRDRNYRIVAAAPYFLRRSLDLLAKGGLGVFVIPNSILTGQSGPLEALRALLLRRHHLVVAFRLPSEDSTGRSFFPGASVVTDVALFRARGHELDAPTSEDEAILKGWYYEQNPTHVLGEERIEDRGGRQRYSVVGSFSDFPEFQEREDCRTCAGRPFTLFVPKQVIEEELPEAVQDAAKLGRRVSRYLTLFSRQTAEALAECARQQPELAAAVKAWHEQPETERLPVLAYGTRLADILTLSSAWGSSGLVEALANPPVYRSAFSGSADDVGALALWLYRRGRGLTFGELQAEHRRQGGSKSQAALWQEALAAGFLADDHEGVARLEDTPLLTEEDYFSGVLWERFDLDRRRAAKGDAAAAQRAERLLALINPVSWVDIQTEPRFAWVPEDLVQAFAEHWLRRRGAHAGTPRFRRQMGVVVVDNAGVYGELTKEEAYMLAGYLNHDLGDFRPHRKQGESLDEVRLRYAADVVSAWTEWIEERPEDQQRLVDIYNRSFRGFVAPRYDEGPLEIGAWAEGKPLRSYQNAGVRRLLAQRGGGLFFDVGLGKTRTILATLALARQEGWARRPVIVVPNSVIWNWVAELAEVLPDFRVVVIGSDKKTLERGERKGQEVSETDTPAERGLKWQRFKAGLYDVALVTYSSLERSELHVDEVLEVIRQTPAVKRTIWTSTENEEAVLERLEAKAQRGTLTQKERARLERLRSDSAELAGIAGKTERQAAIERQREERLAAEVCDPGERELDAGIAWSEIGCDWLCFDESHTGKNLWRAGAREGGAPRYLAAPQEASRIAWQMFYRAAIVRKATGGTGIFLADATPAKNSPLELLSLLSILDSKVWERLQIADAEQFVTAFLKIEVRWVQNADLSLERAPCVVGFRNLDQLRDVLLRYGEFRTAAQVGLKLPVADVGLPITVELDELQEAKYRHYLGSLAKQLSGRQKGSGQAALGILTRLALVALHPDLDGQQLLVEKSAVPRYGIAAFVDKVRKNQDDENAKLKWDTEPAPVGWAEALKHPHPESPKIDALVKRVVEEPGCGHIIFCDILAAQVFIARRLVHFGIPEERIAFLNALKTKTPLERQRVAEAFNQGKYTVVIANAVAYEGINLQRLTCAIWHADLPWEPATLQQRNGRGLRQGNQNDRLRIGYFLSEGSVDMRRYQLITAKRAWMTELIENARNEANNPGAAVDLSPEDWLMFLARDKDALKESLEEVRAEQAEKLRGEARRSAWGKVRGIAARFRERQRATEPLLRQRLERESEALLAELRKVDPEVWPYLALAEAANRAPSLLGLGPDGGIAVEGAVRKSGRQILEFGKLDLESPAIYGRAFEVNERYGDAAQWQRYTRDDVAKLFSDEDPTETWSMVLTDTAWAESLEREIGYGPTSWARRHWPSASEAFLAEVWKRPERLAELVRKSPGPFLVPVLLKGGRLAIWADDPYPADAAAVLPMTEAGLVRFRELVQAERARPRSSLSIDEAERCASSWWGRKL
ncbi:MAG: DEAD/DEAH box helicase [Polyangia bacterium]